MVGAGDRNNDNWQLVQGEIEHNKKKDGPFVVPAVTTDSAQQAYKKVLEACGAILPKRDAVDTRIITQIKQGTGSLINTQDDVGGWPILKSASPPEDSDKDGMPDAWEKIYNLNPKDDSDNSADPDKDGYTNIEEYINNTNPNIKN